MKAEAKEPKRTIFFKNFIAGLGWMTGVTVGFTILVAAVRFLFNWIGGLPLVGEWLAEIITWTNKALEAREVFIR
jgi:hypothetical protein